MSEIHESAVDNGEQIQKKSENDKNGIIGGLIFGGIFLLTYQIYIHFFNNQIGQVFVYILSFLAFICFAVSISCFFDYKESKKIEKLE